MDWNPHLSVLAWSSPSARSSAPWRKTNFCTMGAVSDWVNMGDTGRMRSWLLAIAVAMMGVAALDAFGLRIGNDTFPPYRTANFAWLRYVLGGLMFGIGMTMASGCGNKTLVRLGGGNLKCVVVLGVAAISAYLMLWTGFFTVAFDSWMAPLAIDLAARGHASQALGDLVAGPQNASMANRVIGAVAGFAIAAFAFTSRDFGSNFDGILGGSWWAQLWLPAGRSRREPWARPGRNTR